MIGLEILAFICVPVVLILFGHAVVILHERKNSNHPSKLQSKFFQVLLRYPFESEAMGAEKSKRDPATKLLAYLFIFSVGALLFSMIIPSSQNFTQRPIGILAGGLLFLALMFFAQASSKKRST